MRFAVVALALLLAAPAPGSADQPAGADLDALLARVRATAGEPYAHHIVSTFRNVEAGLSFDVRVESDGYRLLIHRCRGIICDGRYFDGERSYDVNLNETALPVSLHGDDEARTLRAVDAGVFASPGFRAAGGSVVELGTVRQGRRLLRRLAVSIGDATPVDVLIDPESGLVVATATADGKVIDEYRDFRTVDGLTLPFEIWHADARVRRYDSRTVAAAALSSPAGVAPTFKAGPAAVTIQNPGGDHPPAVPQPVVPCSLGGIRVLCLVDTGNSALGISLELAERLGMEPSGEFEVAGLGHYVTGVVTAGPLTVGNATYQAAKYVVLHDLHDYGYDVVLGADAFAHATVSIDYPRSTIAFAPPGGPVGDASIPLRFTDFVPYVDAQLGAFDALLAVDTGDEAAINVSNSYFTAHPGLFTPRGTQQVSGIGGEGEQLVGQLPTVRIGPFEMRNQAIAATLSDVATAGGHIGGALLGHFSVVFDYAHAQLGLTPRPADPAVRQVQQ